MPYNNDDRESLMGWTPEPHGRGTWTLLVSCLTTTFLCTWVTLHARVDNRPVFRLLHKLALFLKTFIAPEFIAVEAAQEWTQARRIKKQFHRLSDGKLSHGEFKLIHAFYIGMYGIRYRSLTPDRPYNISSTKILWPNQYMWLLEQGYISWTPDHQEHWGLCEETILDKSNADSAAKLLALIGVGKFTVEASLRIYHHLPLAPLESMTLSYIPLFALTYFFWWLKPKDIQTPNIIDLPPMKDNDRAFFDKLALTDDFDDEGKPHQESIAGIWRLTPRDFELDLFRNVRPNVSTKYGQGAVLANWDPDLYDSPIMWPITCLFGISFGALHLICWNTVFPTIEEMWMWRASAVSSIVAMLVFMQFRQVILQWSQPESLISMVCAMIYLLGRVVAVVEAFASLRASAPDIYQT